MSKKYRGSRPLIIRSERSLRAAKLAPLVALTIGGCLLSALPQRAAAQEQPATASEDLLLDELLNSTEPEAPAAATAHEPSADAPPASQPETAQPADAGPADEVLPTIAVEQKPAPTPALRQPPSSPQIEEVVVTATKRSENVREIPASIAAVSGDELAARGAQDATDIAKLVPGVNVTSTGDSPQRVTIRGISADIGTSSTTGILFGNVSFTDTYVPVVALDPNPFDMASVEVLKGPQGTLYGASALNGALRYVPNTPRFGEFEVKWFGQYTSVHEGDAAPTYGAAVNLPLYSDELALRVMAFDRTGPGVIDNSRTGAKDVNRIDQQGARALLGWQPNDSWDLLLTTAWQETLFRDVGIADNDEGRLESADRARPSPNRTEYSLAGLSLTYNGDWAQFVSDTSWIEKSGRNFFDASSRTLGTGAVPLLAQTYRGDSTTIGQEFRLVSVDDGDSPWKWVGGVFAWQQDLKNVLTVPLAIDVTPLVTIINLLNLEALSSLFSGNNPKVLETAADVRVRELAAFGEVTRRLGSDVDLSLGGRLYRTVSGGENVQSGPYVLANQLSSPYVLPGEIKETGFNPKASLLWHVNDDVLTYGAISKGFRVGGVQTGLTGPTSNAPDVFKSDTLWNYEVGVRTQFLDNSLRLDLTAFWVDWKDPQSLQPDASGLSVHIANVGGVRSRGADLSVQYLLPWAGLMLTTAVTYADTVTTTDFKTATGDIYPAGTNWPLAPKWQTATNLSFMAPVGDWLLGGFATYSTIGSTTATFGSHEIFGYQQVDLQLSASNERIKWLPQVALILNNVTDERGLTNAFTSGIPTPALAAEEYYYITPRSLTLRFMGRFGG